MSVSRRTLLQIAGVAALPRAASAALPNASWTASAQARLADAPRTLSPQERATLVAVVDAILPRTDTPGALDVQVPAFIEILAAEWLNESERLELQSGLAELDAHANDAHGAAWPALSPAQQQAEIAWGESRDGASTLGQRAFRRIKGWTVHGWLTSERVQREVLRTRIVPGDYAGCVPVAPAPGGAA